MVPLDPIYQDFFLFTHPMWTCVALSHGFTQMRTLALRRAGLLAVFCTKTWGSPSSFCRSLPVGTQIESFKPLKIKIKWTVNSCKKANILDILDKRVFPLAGDTLFLSLEHGSIYEIVMDGTWMKLSKHLRNQGRVRKDFSKVLRKSVFIFNRKKIFL